MKKPKMEGEGKEEEVDANGGINGEDGGDDAAGTATKPEEEDEYFKAYFDLEVRTDLQLMFRKLVSCTMITFRCTS